MGISKTIVIVGLPFGLTGQNQCVLKRRQLGTINTTWTVVGPANLKIGMQVIYEKSELDNVVTVLLIFLGYL